MRRGYVICSYPRSGTNYLCGLLSSTGRLGNPQDWFNGPGIRARGRPDYPLDAPGQMDALRAEAATPNGVYGLKMFVGRFDQLAGFDWRAGLSDLHWIHLDRADALGQGISDVRATQTGQFRSTTHAISAPFYDATAIRASIERTARETARWRLFFARNGITPLMLNYEQVAAAPQAAVDKVAALVGETGPCPIDLSLAPLAVQRDSLSDEWRKRYLAAQKEGVGLDVLPGAFRAGIKRRLAGFTQRFAP